MTEEDGRYRRGTPAFRRTNAALFAAGFATFGLLYCVQPLLPELTRAFDVNPAKSSLSLSVTTGVMAFAMLFAGALADAWNRKAMMVTSVLASSALVLVSSCMPTWTGFLVVRAILGLTLSGLPAVAMTYVSEEVHPDSLGLAMGLYIAGTGLGGMAGRLVAGACADLAGWRVAIAAVGALSFIASVLFAQLLRPSRYFARKPLRLGGFGALFSDAVLFWLFAEGFLLMGSFVTVYNYTGYRLAAPPFSLRPSLIGLVFLVYPVGGLSSTWMGQLADRRGPERVLWSTFLIMLAGLALTIIPSAITTVAGLATITIGFFGGHSVVSSWVGRRAPEARAQASSLYLFAYYMGSSIAGALGGLAWQRDAWRGVVLYTAALLTAGLAVALRLQWRSKSTLS